jgi:hypothetical protein
MKIFLPLFVAITFNVTAQSFQLTVNNGYGSGTYNAGDTVHIWSAAIPANNVFDKWTGDVSFLESKDEWHTTVIMPSQNVSVTANFKNTGGYTIQHESLMGRDTLKEVYSYFPPVYRGVIFCFHGTGGSATNWTTLFEYKQFLNDAVADSFAFIITESEETTKQADLNANGKTNQWNYLPYDSTNVDFANIKILIDTFTQRGKINAATPLYSVGMSNGGAFSSTIATFYKWDAAVSYCASATQLLASVTTVPIQWCMAVHDEHPQVGPQGNAEALSNHNTLLSRGICSNYFAHDRSPVYPERFMRIGSITSTKSANLFAELQSHNLLDANNYLLYPSDTIAQRILAAPLTFPTFLSLTATEKIFVANEVDVMYAGHQFYSDYNKKTLKFFRSPCDTAEVPTTVPEVVEKRNELHVYPNPVKNSLNIETANISAAEEVLVFDILGNKVLSERISEKQFSLSTTALHPGVYFIKVGNQVKRVIKE